MAEVSGTISDSAGPSSTGSTIEREGYLNKKGDNDSTLSDFANISCISASAFLLILLSVYSVSDIAVNCRCT